MEITPPAVGVHLFGADDTQVYRQTMMMRMVVVMDATVLTA